MTERSYRIFDDPIPDSPRPDLASFGRRRITDASPNIAMHTWWTTTETEDHVSFLTDLSLSLLQEQDSHKDVPDGPTKADYLRLVRWAVSQAHDGDPEPWTKEDLR